MGPEEILPLWVRVNLGVMAMKRYSILPKAPGPEPHYQIHFSVIPKTNNDGRVAMVIRGTRVIPVIVVGNRLDYTNTNPEQD